jgi:hypothetical protein
LKLNSKKMLPKGISEIGGISVIVNKLLTEISAVQ